MTGLVFLIEQTSVGLIILIGLLIVWNGYRLLNERAAYRATYYELERDLSRYRQLNLLTAIILLVEVAIIVLGIRQVVAPVIRQEVSLQELSARVFESADGVFNTPTPQPVSSDLGIEPVPLGVDANVIGPQPTPTLTPTPVGTIIPNAPAPFGCNTDNALLQIPTNGMRVFNVIPVVGKAYIDNFAYAKLEIKGPSTFNTFAVIDDKREPIRDVSEFSQFIPTAYEEGWYEFRLMVFDISDTPQAVCMVNIYITAPFPTATSPAVNQ